MGLLDWFFKKTPKPEINRLKGNKNQPLKPFPPNLPKHLRNRPESDIEEFQNLVNFVGTGMNYEDTIRKIIDYKIMIDNKPFKSSNMALSTRFFDLDFDELDMADISMYIEDYYGLILNFPDWWLPDQKQLLTLESYIKVVEKAHQDELSSRKLDSEVSLTSRMKTLDNNSHASDPGSVTLSIKKLDLMQHELVSKAQWWMHVSSGVYPYELKDRRFMLKRIKEQLMRGDSRAAIVMSVNPIIVTAYTDELDCVVLLLFDDIYGEEYNLKVGTRLLTVNIYFQEKLAPDLIEGPKAYHRYGNFAPLIADFLSDDLEKIELRKREIDEQEWQRAYEFGTRYINRAKHLARDARPLFCSEPIGKI